jgi:hypothetical protein
VRNYEQLALLELHFWQQKMQKTTSFFDKVSKRVQDKVNSVIPEKVHAVITVTIQRMIEAVLLGAKFTAQKPIVNDTLINRDAKLEERLKFYRQIASAEGAVTGAGGILLGLADFPILIALKIKFLYDASAIYGNDVKDYRERLYILYIFQLAFSSQRRRREVYKIIENWDDYVSMLPDRVEEFDWRTFQQEYYIDLVKMAQLVPFIGAAVGAIANYKLLNQLGESAKNAFRMRLLKKPGNLLD